MIIRKVSVQDESQEALLSSRGFVAKAGKSQFYRLGCDGRELQLLQLCPWNAPADRDLQTYLKGWHLSAPRCISREITAADMEELLRQSEEGPDIPTLMAPVGLLPFIAMPFSMAIKEGVCEDIPETDPTTESAKLRSTALTEELTRIAAVPEQVFRGHPFVYLCRAGTLQKANRMSRLLFAALRRANRLPSGRFCQVDITMGEFPEPVVEDIFRGQSGATVFLELVSWPEDPADVPALRENLRLFLSAARRHRGSVLTVLHAGQDERFLPLLQENTTAVLSLTEDCLDKTQSQRLLDKLARECGFRKAPVALLRSLPEDCQLTDEQVEAVFQAWYDDYLLHKAYPQYRCFAETGAVKPAAPAATALEELEALVGLREAKGIIRQVADLARAQQLYREHGLAGRMPCLHMAFVGAPGTAKTTVARLVGSILRECGVLKRGHLVETSRSTLVSDHVGGTAKLVSQAFERAQDGILLIDEAYALLDDREGLFGDEAISEIVKQSEDHREDMVMILTGYREPMEKLLNRNAGLRSRVNFMVEFPEYTEDELLEIVELRLEENQRLLTDTGALRVRQILRAAMALPNFGNGRFARSLVEKAMLRQASRVMALPAGQVTDEDIRYLIADDFGDIPQSAEHRRTIGFAG